MLLKKKKNPLEYLERFTQILRTDGLNAALKITSQYITDPSVNPISRRLLYARWIKNNEPTAKQLQEQRIRSEILPHQPLISLVVPVYNPPADVLLSTLDSVSDQTYANWECCIVNGDPTNLKIKATLDQRAVADPRFKVMHLDRNLGIAGNTNQAIAMASGSYVAFLDHDDLLAPFALYEIVLKLWAYPDIDLFYSDEDNIDEKGKRTDPLFKPGFSPDYLCSVNYMCHFLVIRKEVGDELGWIREGYEGAQDFDFILRASERTGNIERVPKILYHWRSVKGSTATDFYAKPYAGTSGIKALEDHLQRINCPGRVETNFMPTWYRVNYDLQSTPLVSIIILNHDHAEDLKKLIRSVVEQSTYKHYEIIIIENNSQEPTTFTYYDSLLVDYENIKIIKFNEPFNYSRANNFAVQHAKGDVLLFLNNDIEIITPGWIEEMLMHAVRPKVGSVGAKLLYPNNTVQHAGVIVGIGEVAGHGHKGFTADRVGYGGQLKQVHNTAANTAACLMIRRQVFQQVEGFDENYILAFGDVDLCLKLLGAGLLNVWTPFAELFHHESKTRGYERSSVQLARYANEVYYFKQKWKDFLAKGDPYYNPNLTMEKENYKIDPAPKSYQG